MFIHTPMLYTPVCLYTPHMFVCPPYICIAPRGCTPPGAPTCFCAPAWFWHIACCGGGLFFCLMCIGTHHPYLGVPPLFYTPHTLLLVLCALLFSGISVLMWAFSPSIEGFGGVPLITGGGWGDTSVAVHMLILLHLFL